MDKKNDRTVVNHFEAGSNCQVFNAEIRDCVFAMPGLNVTQEVCSAPRNAIRHRPSSSFEQFIIDPARAEEVIHRLHELIDGKLPKNCALTIFAAQQKGWLTMPSYRALSDEFSEIGDRKNYTYYISRKDNYQADIDSIEKGL